MTPDIYIVSTLIIVIALLIAAFWSFTTKRNKKVRTLAHDLRTRLAVIKTNSEIQLLDESTDPKIKELLTSNVDEVNHASHILNNMSR